MTEAAGRPDEAQRLDELLGDVAGVAAVELLDERFPQRSDDVRNWPACEPLLEHVHAAVDAVVAADAVTPQAVGLLVRGADYLTSHGSYVAAREWLRRANELGRALTLEAPAQAALARAVAGLLVRLGEAQRAPALLRRAFELDLDTFGPEHLSSALDRCALADALTRIDALEDAREQAIQAVATLDALGRRDGDGVSARRILGSVLTWLEEYDAARIAIDAALAMAEGAVGPEHPEVARSRGVLALWLEQTEDLDGARGQYEEALAISEAALGADHPEVAEIAYDLALLLNLRRQFADALPLLERSLAVAERVLPRHHVALWERHTALAETLEALGRFDVALRQRELALAWSEGVEGTLHVRFAEDLAALGRVRWVLRDEAAGIAGQRRAVALIEKLSGRDAPQLAEHHRSLGGAYWEQGSFGRAAASFARASEIDARAEEVEFEWNNRTDALYVAHSLRELSGDQARAYEAIGDAESAAELGRRADAAVATAVAHSLDGDDPDALVSSSVALAEIGEFTAAHDALARATERVEEGVVGETEARWLAERVVHGWEMLGWQLRSQADDLDAVASAHERRVALLASLRPGDLAERSLAVAELAEVQVAQERIERGEQTYREAIALARAAGSADLLQESLSALGRLLAGRGELDAALELFEERLSTLRAAAEPDLYAQGVVLHDLAEIHMTRTEADVAVEQFSAALEHKRRGADGDPARAGDVATTAVGLARALVAQGDGERATALLREVVREFDTRPASDVHAEALARVSLAGRLWNDEARDEAVGILRRAVICEQRGGDLQRAADVLGTLGDALWELRRIYPALTAQRQRLTLLESLDPRQPLAEGDVLTHIGDAERRIGDREAALEHYRDALVRLGEGDAATLAPRSRAGALSGLGRVLKVAGRLDEALAVLGEHLALLKALPERDPQTEGVALHDIAEVHLRRGDPAAAVERFEQAVDRKRAADAESRRPRDIALTLTALADALEAAGELERVAALRAEAAQLRGE